MSMTCGKLFSILEDFAPLSLAEEWDNVGLQLGDPLAQVQRVLIALDVDERVCREAEEKGVELIISHHPLIFKPVKKISLALPEGALLARLIRAGIAVYSAHTNLDSAVGGG